MNIDLQTNAGAINAAVDDVRNGVSTWCILGFDKTKRTVKVADTAEGEGEEDDLNELESSFNDTKAQFAFVSVKDDNTELRKLVFIKWCGEAVKALDKSKFPSQGEAVQQKFPGAHVMIEARDSGDVTRVELKRRVAKASGANYSIHKEKADPKGYAPTKVHGSGYEKPDVSWSKSGPSIHTNDPSQSANRGYQKAEITAGNASSFKDRFEPGAQAQREEETRWRVEAERKARTEREASERATAAPTAGSAPQEEKATRRLSAIAREEARSAPMGLPPRGGGGLSMPGMPPPPSGGSSTAPISVASTPASAGPPPPSSGGFGGPPPPGSGGFGAPPPSNFAPPPMSDPEPQDVYDNNAGNDYEEPDQNQYAEPDDQQQYNEPNQTEYAEPDQYNEEPQYELPDQSFDPAPVEDNVYAEPEQPFHQEPPPPAEEEFDWGICATTIYDYQAADADEVGFDVGEVITNIEKIDDGWWRGMNARNETGIFPANYVQEHEA